MIRRLVLSVLGYILACIAAGATLVAFIHTPAELAALGGTALMDRLSDSAVMALAVGTQVMIFAFLFSLIAIAAAEWFGLRSWIYYALVSFAIALVGFLAQFYAEGPQQPSIVNNYALVAFVTTSLVAATVYWLVAGRHAGRRTRIVKITDGDNGDGSRAPSTERSASSSSVPEIDPGRTRDTPKPTGTSDVGNGQRPAANGGNRPRTA